MPHASHTTQSLIPHTSLATRVAVTGYLRISILPVPPHSPPHPHRCTHTTAARQQTADPVFTPCLHSLLSSIISIATAGPATVESFRLLTRAATPRRACALPRTACNPSWWEMRNRACRPPRDAALLTPAHGNSSLTIRPPTPPTRPLEPQEASLALGCGGWRRCDHAVGGGLAAAACMCVTRIDKIIVASLARRCNVGIYQARRSPRGAPSPTDVPCMALWYLLLEVYE